MKKTAKYEKIYQDLKDKILTGAYSDGKLPPVSELTGLYGASLLTVNNAVKLLVEDGIVSRSGGRSGTRINQPGLRRMNLSKSNSNTWDGNADIFRRRKVTLRYLTDSSAHFLPKQMPSIIREFESRYPWIRIEQDFTDDTDFLKNSGHDIIQASHSAMLPLISRRRLLDLTLFFEKFGSNNNFFREKCTIPLMLSLPILCYADDTIDSLPSSWQDLLNLNQQLKKENKCSAIQLGFFSLLHFFIGDIRENLFDKKKEKDFILLIEILRDYYKWQMPWNNFAPSEISSAVMSNKISILAAYSNSTLISKSNNLKTAPLPYCNSYLAETVRIGINADCRHIPEAWLWVNFLRSEAVQKKLIETSYGIPYHEKVFNSDFKDKFPSLYQTVLPLLDKINEPQISDAAREMIYHVVYPLLEKCFANDFSAQSCIKSLREAINEMLILDSLDNNF